MSNCVRSRYRKGMKDLILGYRALHPSLTSVEIAEALDCRPEYVRTVVRRNGESLRRVQPAAARDARPLPQPPAPKPSAVYDSGFIRPPSKARLMAGKA